MKVVSRTRDLSPFAANLEQICDNGWGDILPLIRDHWLFSKCLTHIEEPSDCQRFLSVWIGAPAVYEGHLRKGACPLHIVASHKSPLQLGKDQAIGVLEIYQ